jgi:hypothetical protein
MASYGRTRKERLKPVENAAATLQRVALVSQHVFEADDHTGQSARSTIGKFSIYKGSLLAGFVGPHF